MQIEGYLAKYLTSTLPKYEGYNKQGKAEEEAKETGQLNAICD